MVLLIVASLQACACSYSRCTTWLIPPAYFGVTGPSDTCKAPATPTAVGTPIVGERKSDPLIP